MRLRIMTWNLSWAYGEGSTGNQAYQPRTRAWFIDKLDRMARVIRDQGVDLLLAQEVDFRSARSHDIDEMRMLAFRSGLKHCRAGVSWDLRYLPYPPWPPRRQFGRIQSGGAILSRYPLPGGETRLFSKPESFSRLYRHFYLSRYFQIAQVELPIGTWTVANLHLEAWDRANREAQAGTLARWARIQGSALLAIGGDFNCVPPGSAVKSGFADEPRTDFRGDSTIETITALPGLHPAETDQLTFPAFAPNRRLDHLFVARSWRIMDTQVVPCSALSDHLPLLTTIEQDQGASPNSRS